MILLSRTKVRSVFIEEAVAKCVYADLFSSDEDGIRTWLRHDSIEKDARISDCYWLEISDRSRFSLRNEASSHVRQESRDPAALGDRKIA